MDLELEMSLISRNVRIVVMQNDGKVLEIQSLADFLAEPDPLALAAVYGNTFLDLLLQESYVTEELQLKQVLTGNPHADATRLCGNLAEALVVKYCNTHPEINRILARYARFGDREDQRLDNYIAIGTASKITQSAYAQHYQPNDTQRDLIWIDRTDGTKQLNCVGGTGMASTPAGLQVKASHDGMGYVFPSVKNYFYPILYFDLKDDWHDVNKALVSAGIQATLIHPDSIMSEIKAQLQGYYRMVVAIIEGKLTVAQIAEHARETGDSALLAGLTASDVASDLTCILKR